MPTYTAALLLDLQVDFLDAVRTRMPVDPGGAQCVMSGANAVLTDPALAGALPVLIVNQLPVTARLANFFRHGAAVAGGAGASLDPRVLAPANTQIFRKAQADGFTYPNLEPFLRSRGITTVWVMSLFAEGCVRATAHAARRLGFEVIVSLAEVATNASWKAAFARWVLRKRGITTTTTVHETTRAT